MKKYLVWLCIASLSVVLAGCDWSAGGSSDGFNTSQGAGINVNISGVYAGAINGRAVERTSGAGQILTLIISQAGNTVEVSDNQGSTYHGSIGAPGAVSQATGGIYPAGAEMVQYQINFSGKDEVAAQDVEFVGIIHLISVTDIRGSSSSTGSTTTDETTHTTTDTIVDALNDTTTDTITTTIGAPGDPFYRVTTQVIVTQTSTGEVISNTTTTTGTSSSTTTREYSITEANSQLRLEGTWIEAGGLSARVDAISRGAGGTITESSTETTTTDPVATP